MTITPSTATAWPALSATGPISASSARQGSGREALEQVSLLQPDVVVVDMRMPDVDGLGVIAAVGRDFPATQVLVLSADPTETLPIRRLPKEPPASSRRTPQ